MTEFRSYRPDNFPPVIKNLIIINALVYVAQNLLEKQYAITEKFMLWPIIPEQLRKILVDQKVLGESDKFSPYQILTHMFSHSPMPNIYHILFNMFTLWMFGRILENVWGQKKFLFFYLACGVGAAALHLGIQYFRSEELLQAILTNNEAGVLKFQGALAPALGASGAIMGVMAAFAYLFPNTELYLMFIPIPIKAKWAIIGFAALDLFGGVANISGDNLAHFAHLGGALTGFIIVFIWNKTNRKTFY